MGQTDSSIFKLTVPSRMEELAAVQQLVEQASQAFGAKLEQDLNVPGALGVMFELVRYLNTALDDGDLGPPDAQLVLPVFERFDAVLGVMARRASGDEGAVLLAFDQIIQCESAGPGRPERSIQ